MARTTRTYDHTCPCGNAFTSHAHNSVYCPGCKATRNTGPRVSTRLNTSVRICKGIRLNANVPLSKLFKML